MRELLLFRGLLAGYRDKAERVNPFRSAILESENAAFVRQLPVLYSFVNFEANIVLQVKANALLIPRRLLIDNSTMRKTNGQLTQV